jgi:hypothetical protein
MRLDFYKLNQNSKKKCEVIFVCAISAVFILFLYNILINGKRMFAHDTLWIYGLSQYFYNAMMHGVFPYWDLYDYSGQPIYPQLGISRLMEIPSILLVWLNRLTNFSLLSLYHWDFILKLIVVAIGVYLCFRQTNKYVVSNFVVFLSFLFSSFIFASFRQCGLLTSFSWTPWAMWFILRLRRSFTLYNVIGLSLFMGLVITSYQAGYVFTFLSLFCLSLLINDREWVSGLLQDKKSLVFGLIALLIVCGLSLQIFAVYKEKNNSIPVLRKMDSDDPSRAYEDKSGGSPSYPNDFMGLIFPPLAIHGWMGQAVGVKSKTMAGQWVTPLSECPLYIGILPLLLAVLGLIFSPQKYKLNFFLMFFFSTLLSFGMGIKIGFIGKILFPFLLYARNMELFQPFVIFSLMYFSGQGMDAILERSRKYAE